MKIQYLEQTINYDGTQLRSHWIYDVTGVVGDTMVAFCGACDVTTDHLVDLEDARNNRPIASQSMLHFIGEFFELSLKETILLQRLLVSQLQQLICVNPEVSLKRTGNDLYDEDKKLSVSIATSSRTSTLIHAGINISSKGTPVPTKGLADYLIDPMSFAQEVLSAFQQECASLHRDLAKVRAVD